MTPLDELTQLASQKARRIFVTEEPLDLRVTEGSNCVYVLELPGSAPGAAGGRIGGLGERRIVKAYCFRLEAGKWMKIYETEAEERLGKFELPYHAAGLTIILPDGSERVVSGVVDREFIEAYDQAA